MKIQHVYTVKEAERELASCAPMNVEVRIEGNPPIASGTLPVVNIMRAVDLIRSFHHKSDGKIPAIKAYREWASKNGLDTSLVSAKFFVESIN